ncbi:MAG: HNH endonuclease [Nonomuraea sp.]|nr:HNH endonuclease [Nonomuraea sp.]NUR71588.1 HNH endonuclease [Hamadaea sp.]NUT19501.1 HNH endonuclease [Hamadaea sp.]
MTGYSRDRFPHWRSAGTGCDVRDKVLQRDGKNVKLTGCNVTGGTWVSWYDDTTQTELTKVDIDHMVPLANAWRSGADKWTDDQRSDFANDMERPQLFAVSASSNRSKGDQDPSTWKPPSQGAWCVYAQDWITVKAYYKLTITAKEKDALSAMLATCA